MSEARSTTTTHVTTPPVVAPPKPVALPLAPASESCDGYVQQLLGERQSAYMNGDTDAADAVTAQLAELGLK